MQVITSGLKLPEGPIAMADGSVIVVEVFGGRLTRVASDGTKTTIAELGGGPNGAAIGPDGRCYVCNNGGMSAIERDGILYPLDAPEDTAPGSIQVVDLATGSFKTLYAHSAETPFWGPNDLVFDDSGGFWFTDHGRSRGRIRQRGSLWYAKADGSHIREVVFPMDGCNGVGLSPDGSKLYVAETFSGHVLRLNLSAPGVIATAEEMAPHGAAIHGRAGPGQFLDSLAVDSGGYVCIASPVAGGILVFPPEGGAPEHIPLPDFMTTNICFGGPDLKTAFVTLGSSGRLVSIPWPRPGVRLHHQ
jgi:gluconolactonase